MDVETYSIIYVYFTLSLKDYIYKLEFAWIKSVLQTLFWSIWICFNVWITFLKSCLAKWWIKSLHWKKINNKNVPKNYISMST
jgi:hypothetical protein